MKHVILFDSSCALNTGTKGFGEFVTILNQLFTFVGRTRSESRRLRDSLMKRSGSGRGFRIVNTLNAVIMATIEDCR